MLGYKSKKTRVNEKDDAERKTSVAFLEEYAALVKKHNRDFIALIDYNERGIRPTLKITIPEEVKKVEKK